MRKLLLWFLTTLLAISFGCTTGLRRETYRRPPRKIDWQDPVSVMRGFLAAKKNGDWRTAYRCCDYDETLPKQEREKIKRKWKEECERWPIDYANTLWIITDRSYDADTAVVRIVVSRRNPITHELNPGETYKEKLKKYKDAWKISGFLAPETPE